jgi:hypothetical protein
VGRAAAVFDGGVYGYITCFPTSLVYNKLSPLLSSYSLNQLLQSLTSSLNRQPGEVRYRNASDTGSEDEFDEFDEASEFMRLVDLDDDDWRAFA